MLPCPVGLRSPAGRCGGAAFAARKTQPDRGARDHLPSLTLFRWFTAVVQEQDHDPPRLRSLASRAASPISNPLCHEQQTWLDQRFNNQSCNAAQVSRREASPLPARRGRGRGRRRAPGTGGSSPLPARALRLHGCTPPLGWHATAAPRHQRMRSARASQPDADRFLRSRLESEPLVVVQSPTASHVGPPPLAVPSLDGWTPA